ncbi:MAG: hypothetical protein N2V77_01230 [Canidatus Methanoxibalbensis ujae]|nr:hypothetical protein [Candidatus Methanoxibalbensis ujae]
MDKEKMEKMYRGYLLNKLPKMLDELIFLAERRATNKWTQKEAKELRRKFVEVKKELHKARQTALKVDKLKVKNL